MKIVQELLGHSSMSITAGIYGHGLPSIYKSAMDKMDGFLGSSSS
jgi:integrase